jgi:hypothetical protein
MCTSGHGIPVPLLLVDDRDGRIVAELQKPKDVVRILEAWTRDDAYVPDYLCIVEVDSRPGAIVGTDSSVRIHPLT